MLLMKTGFIPVRSATYEQDKNQGYWSYLQKPGHEVCQSTQ